MQHSRMSLARKIWPILSFSLALGGCGHQRQPVSPGMAVPATKLIATPFADPSAAVLPSNGPANGPTAGLSLGPAGVRLKMPALQSAFAREILTQPLDRYDACATLARVHPFTRISDASHYVVLSGGGPHGAFGAGFFLGLQDAHLLPAEPAVVTGVSTGALQSTFVFMARQAVPEDRKPYRWASGMAVENGDLAGGRSNLEDLALAYSITRENEILRPTGLHIFGAHLPGGGATGTLAPLHDRLLNLITPQTIEALAVEACRGRKLYVGAVSLDDGNAYAFNLTALALRAYDKSYPAPKKVMRQVRESYVNTLLASSTVPIGALPVQLRIREGQEGGGKERVNLFIDGGARNGVFFHGADEALQADQTTQNDMSLVINTVLGKDPWSIDKGNIDNPSARWGLFGLAGRTVDILIDQVYQFSVADVSSKSQNLRVAILDDWHLPGETPDKHMYRTKQGEHTCEVWHKMDHDKADPIEFYPRYMACLIDYGRKRGAKNLWNKPGF
jgi:predicted acylesterase/phospholipase RssA